jgi:hypothetical protein
MCLRDGCRRPASVGRPHPRAAVCGAAPGWWPTGPRPRGWCPRGGGAAPAAAGRFRTTDPIRSWVDVYSSSGRQRLGRSAHSSFERRRHRLFRAVPWRGDRAFLASHKSSLMMDSDDGWATYMSLGAAEATTTPVKIVQWCVLCMCSEETWFLSSHLLSSVELVLITC